MLKLDFRVENDVVIELVAEVNDGPQQIQLVGLP